MMRLVIGIDGGQDHDGDKGAVRNLQQRRLQSVEAEALDDQGAATRWASLADGRMWRTLRGTH